MENKFTSILNLRDLPDFMRSQILANQGREDRVFPGREKLHSRLTKLITGYLSEFSLELEDSDIAGSFDNLPEWRIDTVLAKLRSLMEIKAKKQIREFCSRFSRTERQSIQALLNNAGIHKFRESIEIDLYVGTHTAISAYYKIIGLVLQRQQELEVIIPLKTACEPIFKNLRYVASLSLRHLMALDGLFWDSGQYGIPQEITARLIEDKLEFFIDSQLLTEKLAKIKPDEQQLGCPALSAKTMHNQRVISLVEDCCLKSVEKYFLAADSAGSAGLRPATYRYQI